LLVGIGGAISVAISPAVLRTFLQLSPVALPTYIVLAPDAGTVLVAFGSIVLVSMIAAVIPASLATRTAPAEAWRTGGRSSVSGRKERQWGGVLVAAETAFTLVVLVAGSLLLLSYSKLHAVPLGYQVEGIARLAVTANRLDVADAPAFPAFVERKLGTADSHLRDPASSRTARTGNRCRSWPRAAAVVRCVGDALRRHGARHPCVRVERAVDRKRGGSRNDRPRAPRITRRSDGHAARRMSSGEPRLQP
jgi:hypothetical protein